MAVEVPVWEKFSLSIKEVAIYFGIGEEKLRTLCDNEPNLAFYIGNHRKIKRRKMEEYLLTVTDI